MGEENWRVHTVGFPAIDLISEGSFASPTEIESLLGIDASRPIVLFTQHSVTTEYEKATSQLRPSLAALNSLASDGIQVIITYPNNDAGGQEIIRELQEFPLHPNIVVKTSLGRYLYHGVLALARNPDKRIVCVGNSSSGIKETPVFGCPTVNIGSRQEGRLRGENVIDADYESDEIYSAVSSGLFEETFRKKCRATNNPYWLGGAGVKIAEILSHVPLGQVVLQKKMTLLGESKDGWFR
jgi:UDP-N-acetylglucosamine 2-epimerase (non-hydrolysing)/GDP/UDP-N,N'-diacetylbacillosamine 2-epimerase (hydrolysing)